MYVYTHIYTYVEPNTYTHMRTYTKLCIHKNRHTSKYACFYNVHIQMFPCLGQDEDNSLHGPAN